MKPFTAPTIDLLEFDLQDILTLSSDPNPNPGPSEPELPPDEF